MPVTPEFELKNPRSLGSGGQAIHYYSDNKFPLSLTAFHAKKKS
jgi:hypothetical protein